MTRKERERRMDRKIVEMLKSGSSLRQIMRCLHVGDRRIHKVQILAKERGYFGETPVPLPAYPAAIFPEVTPAKTADTGPLSDAEEFLLPKKDWIKERLTAGWHPITVFEEIGVPVSRSSFYRFLIRHDLRDAGSLRRVVPEIVHEPGEALLLDWGKLCDVTNADTGKKKPLWVFVGILGFSRYTMIRLVWTNDVATTMDAIQSMLREIGGVPKRVTSDNPKCFALEASYYEPLLNPAFERLAAHYNFLIECLPPRSPEKKGKVERPMPFTRRIYEAHGVWHSLEESQAYMDRKLVIANQRKHGTTRQQPIEQFINIEAGALRPLPPLSYAPETVSYGFVRRDGHVRFENRYYSLAEKFIGEKVVMLGGANEVSIYHNGILLEVHVRLSDNLRSKSTKPEHLKPWEREMQNDCLHRERARAIGPNVERLIIRIIENQAGFVDTRKIWGVLSLDKSYTKDRIDEACGLAIKMDSFSYRTVKNLLVNLPSADAAAVLVAAQRNGSVNGQHKFVRPLSVYEEQLQKLHN